MWADLVMSGFRPRNIGAIAGKKEAEVLLLHKQARLLAPFVESMLDPRFGDCIHFEVRIARRDVGRTKNGAIAMA